MNIFNFENFQTDRNYLLEVWENEDEIISINSYVKFIDWVNLMKIELTEYLIEIK